MLLADGSFLSQMMLLAGMILLAWILIRRNLKLRRSAREAERQFEKSPLSKRGPDRSTVPLADAPKEVLRWQAEMFDLQRELRAELDTKILVVQTMINQADQRIAHLERLNPSGQSASQGQVSPSFSDIRELSQNGHTAEEIADKLGIPQAEIEFSLATGSDIPSLPESV